MNSNKKKRTKNGKEQKTMVFKMHNRNNNLLAVHGTNHHFVPLVVELKTLQKNNKN